MKDYNEYHEYGCDGLLMLFDYPGWWKRFRIRFCLRGLRSRMDESDLTLRKDIKGSGRRIRRWLARLEKKMIRLARLLDSMKIYPDGEVEVTEYEPYDGSWDYIFRQGILWREDEPENVLLWEHPFDKERREAQE